MCVCVGDGGGMHNGLIMAGENRRLWFFCDREERVLWEERTNFCDMEGYKVMLRKVCFREKKRDYDPSSCVRIHVSLDSLYLMVYYYLNFY